MENDIAQLHRRIKRSKFAIYAILGFLIILTLGIILIFRQSTQKEAIIYKLVAKETTNNRLTPTIVSKNITKSTYYNNESSPRKIAPNKKTTNITTSNFGPNNFCGRCVSKLNYRVWNEDDPENVEWNSKKCQVRVKCVNGKLDRSKLDSDPFLKSRFGSSGKFPICCLHKSEFNNIKDSDLEEGPMGEDEYVCEPTSPLDLFNVCLGGNYHPDWDLIISKLCGCGYIRSDVPIKGADCSNCQKDCPLCFPDKCSRCKLYDGTCDQVCSAAGCSKQLVCKNQIVCDSTPISSCQKDCTCDEPAYCDMVSNCLTNGGHCEVFNGKGYCCSGNENNVQRPE